MGTAITTHSCALCNEPRKLLDEHSRCEECVIAAERLAWRLDDAEAALCQAVELGVTAERLRRWLEMFLGGECGPLEGTEVARDESGWDLWRPSAFQAESDDAPDPNPIRRLRRASRMSLEQLAEAIDVQAPELARWERFGDVPDAPAERLAALFGVSVDYVMGEPWSNS